MEKYTANYVLTNPNFVIQNLIKNETELQGKPLLYILKNLLQRGFPTILSKNLQKQIGEIHKNENFKVPFLFISPSQPRWIKTIRGDEQNQYFPAKDFFENVIANQFGEYSFIQSLILPEVEINEITQKDTQAFISQQVDFYLPQAKLVIEIDGRQHNTDHLVRVSDEQRDRHLLENGVKVIRISTDELRNKTYQSKIDSIIHHLEKPRFSFSLNLYKEAYQKIKTSSLDSDLVNDKIIPSGVIRFQILLIELLLNHYLEFGKPWKINLILKKNEELGNFAELAIEDFFIWFEQLFLLKNKTEFIRPNVELTVRNSLDGFNNSNDVINIDFSLFERWTDENELMPDLIIVRTDYFGAEKNYFKVSCTKPIVYKITEDDKTILEFFLQNIFEKPSFREGQFPIISNVLNHKDTIGLLPTGGGKSLCYQLPCLLQPSVSFVVCPIKSLMYDQNSNIKSSYITNTNFITSDQSSIEKNNVEVDFALGKYLFVWISPERFQKKEFRRYISDISSNLSIAYAVIDEVHCMSEWGHDFRTSYLNLTRSIQKFCPESKFIGLTATASVNVLKDIKIEFSRNGRILRDENIKSLLDYSRKELEFEIIKEEDKFSELEEIVEQNDLINLTTKKSSLIFTPHVNGEYGCFHISNKLNLIQKGSVSWYSGGVPKYKTTCFANQHEIDNTAILHARIIDVLKNKGIQEELINNIISNERYEIKRTRNGGYFIKIGNGVPVLDTEKFKKHKISVQSKFKEDKFPVLVATKAFGMGIDKSNIYNTIHYGIPSSVEALYQEAGRAGRWEDKDRKAKCYVLYSPETTDPANVNRLFDLDTSFAEIKEISEGLGWNEGKDIFKQMLLFLQGSRDIHEEFNAINLIIDNYFLNNSNQVIYFNTISTELRGIGLSGTNEILKEVAQKAIYRLRILGIVSDWTTDFVTHFEVQFQTKDEDSVYSHLNNFLSKYQADILLKEELSQVIGANIIEKSIRYLLKWTFENIAYSRKQSLKTLSDWCNEFDEIGNAAFKTKIDNYFRFTDTTFIFQHIAEHPKKYQNWFDVFYIDNNIVKGKEGTFIHDIQDKATKTEELERLRDSLSRFLESYRNNVGLNFISGLIRLSLDEYNNPDGKNRFESSLEYIRSKMPEGQVYLIEKLIEFGIHLSDENKENLCFSIAKYYPEKIERLAEYYGLFYLLDDKISEKINRLKIINKNLYVEFEQIGTI